MGTLFLSCVCDSLLAKLCEKGCLSITEIHQAGTDCHDVCIVFIICVAVAFIALIAALTVFGLKYKEIKAKEKERKAQKEKEEEESRRKQIADCQGKLIDFLDKQVKSFDIQKDQYEKASEEYMECLQSIVDDKDEDKNSRKQELKTYLWNQIIKFDKQTEKYKEACECYKNELKNLIENMNNGHEDKNS